MSGCRPAAGGPTPGGAAKEAGAITVLQSNWAEPYLTLMKKIGDEFTNDTGITVTWDVPPSAPDEKLITEVAAGDSPDATYTAWNSQGSLAYRGVLAPLDDYLKKAGLSRKDFNPAMYASATYQGKQLALPGGSDWIPTFWSKGLYQEVGLDPEKPPKTFAELEQHSDKLTRSGPDGYTRVGFWPGSSGPSYLQILYLYGGELYDDATGKVTANHPKVVEAFEWLANYAKKMDYTKMSNFWKGKPGYTKEGNPFNNGLAAYLSAGFWAYDSLDKLTPSLKYGIAPSPTTSGAASEMSRNLIQGWLYAIPKGANQPDRGWKFIKYAFVDNSAKMGYLTLNGPCYLKQLDEFSDRMVKDVLKSDNRMTPYFKVFIDIARNGSKHFPALPITSDYNKALSATFNDVFSGAKPARQALDDLTQTMQAQMDQVKR
jgi:multiple sugar transport system substrate-binding protein